MKTPNKSKSGNEPVQGKMRRLMGIAIMGLAALAPFRRTPPSLA